MTLILLETIKDIEFFCGIKVVRVALSDLSEILTFRPSLVGFLWLVTLFIQHRRTWCFLRYWTLINLMEIRRYSKGCNHTRWKTFWDHQLLIYFADTLSNIYWFDEC